MTELTQYTFEDRDFRFTVDEKIVAADLAQALGYRNAPDMTRSLDDDEKGTQIVRTPGGDQEVTVVTEAGFYRACLARQAGYIKDVAAKAFVKRLQRWVTPTVLVASILVALVLNRTTGLAGWLTARGVRRVFFVGEHLSDDWYGYMNGAAQTGRLAAQAVRGLIARA